jgi:hydrogenase maturation protease
MIPNPILLVALGSPLMQDDGVGIKILEELQRRGVKADYIDLGTDIFRLRIFFNNHSKIVVVDALTGGGSPGSVFIYHQTDFKKKLTGIIKNSHHLSFYETIELLRMADPNLAKTEIYLVGVVAKKIDKGIKLSRPVEQAIQRAADTVIGLF